MSNDDRKAVGTALSPTQKARDESVLLDVRHVSVEYATERGGVHAVEDVSFTLKRGQILGLAGESGSGKSTLAYAIARLLRPPALITQGEAYYYPPERKLARYLDLNEEGGIDIFKLTRAQLRAFRWNELAIVFQSAMNALNPVMSLEKQMTDVLQVHAPELGRQERKQRAIELLRLVGIAPDRLRSYPHELSGGMRQRAIIAIALALNPEIIIMDEPTTALDVVVQREILKELLALRKQFNFAVIFITHDLSLLIEIADTIAIMYAGRLVETAPGKEIYRHPRHPYTYGLLNSFPSLHGEQRQLTGIPGTPPDLRAVPTGCAFNPRCALKFAPCTSVIPVLRAPINVSTATQVACHLYDQELRPEGPPEQLNGVARYEEQV